MQFKTKGENGESEGFEEECALYQISSQGPKHHIQSKKNLSIDSKYSQQFLRTQDSITLATS